MYGMKYIVYDCPYKGLMPFIFSNQIQHADFAMQNGLEDKHIRSAGSITFGSTGPKCFGNSLTLSKAVHENDEYLILQNLEP